MTDMGFPGLYGYTIRVAFPEGSEVVTRLEFPGEWVTAKVLQHLDGGAGTEVEYEGAGYAVPTEFLRDTAGRTFWGMGQDIRDRIRARATEAQLLYFDMIEADLARLREARREPS